MAKDKSHSSEDRPKKAAKSARSKRKNRQLPAATNAPRPPAMERSNPAISKVGDLDAGSNADSPTVVRSYQQIATMFKKLDRLPEFTPVGLRDELLAIIQPHIDEATSCEVMAWGEMCPAIRIPTWVNVYSPEVIVSGDPFAMLMSDRFAIERTIICTCESLAIRDDLFRWEEGDDESDKEHVASAKRIAEGYGPFAVGRVLEFLQRRYEALDEWHLCIQQKTEYLQCWFIRDEVGEPDEEFDYNLEWLDQLRNANDTCSDIVLTAVTPDLNR